MRTNPMNEMPSASAAGPNPYYSDGFCLPPEVALIEAFLTERKTKLLSSKKISAHIAVRL